jgi:amino acid transporter
LTLIPNLAGQIAGVASGGYSGAEVIADIIQINYGYVLAPAELLGVFALVLVLAGIINSFAEQLLTRLCSISVIWHIGGTIIIVALMIHFAPTLQPASYAASSFNNATPFESSGYVVLIGSLSAASTFTGTTRHPLCHPAVYEARSLASLSWQQIIAIFYSQLSYLLCMTQVTTHLPMSLKRRLTHTCQRPCPWWGP